MKQSKKLKIFLLFTCFFLLTGCSETLKDKENNPVKNEETGQIITENIICKPTESQTIEIYEQNEDTIFNGVNFLNNNSFANK